MPFLPPAGCLTMNLLLKYLHCLVHSAPIPNNRTGARRWKSLLDLEGALPLRLSTLPMSTNQSKIATGQANKPIGTLNKSLGVGPY